MIGCVMSKTTGQPSLAKGLAIQVSSEVGERREQRRLEEWEVCVPTVGAIYCNTNEYGLWEKTYGYFYE